MYTSDWKSRVSAATSMVEIIRRSVHVLLVDHVQEPSLIDILEHFFLKVTAVKFASSALEILSRLGNTQFDLVLENIHSPDACGYKLLQEAVNMDLPVILLMEEDDGVLTKRALEDGALLCIKKPITVEIVRYFWQLVLWQNTRTRNRSIQLYRDYKLMNNNIMQEGDHHLNLINATSEESHNMHIINPKMKSCENDYQERFRMKTKGWTEWTQELHDQFMAAVAKLGEGRCYPKDILELMNVPGLTRMQVASHLQKCRRGTWVPPDKRRPKTSRFSTTVAAKSTTLLRSSGSTSCIISTNNSGFMPPPPPNSSSSSSSSSSDLHPKTSTPNQNGDSNSSIPSPPHIINTDQYFDFPNMDSIVQTLQVPIPTYNHNVPAAMKEADEEEEEKEKEKEKEKGEESSKTADDHEGKIQVVEKEDE